MTNSISIVWFRQDLRIADNPALFEAAKSGSVLPIYILDDLAPEPCKLGDVTKVYLYQALQYLDQSLDGHLNLYKSSPEKVISKLAKNYDINHIYWSRCYEPWLMADDEKLEHTLQTLNIRYTVFNGSYLWSPSEIAKEDGSYYKVFGAYKRKIMLFEPRKPLAKPKSLQLIKDKQNKTTLKQFKLIPDHPWYKQVMEHWTVGEEEAKKKLAYFIKNELLGYKAGRDYPNLEQTSKLSPHLHFGEISPYQVWDAISSKSSKTEREDAQHFLSEMIWREFSAYLLFHFPGLYKDNFIKKFNAFPWINQKSLLKAWQKGNTGYPFVDAGMRELWQTGYMHNRVRMIVASFLVKNLMIHWHHGRDWFWNCLADADLGNNSASWQWVAGSGVDSAPYFRIFNPSTQGKKFDAEAQYIKKYVPELKKLDNKYLFEPWTAPQKILIEAGIVLGKTYPKPIIDLKTSREAALLAYKRLK